MFSLETSISSVTTVKVPCCLLQANKCPTAPLQHGHLYLSAHAISAGKGSAELPFALFIVMV